ncbi:MAG: transcription antitermination factor NusB [Candidatus Kapaibacterium sp.]
MSSEHSFDDELERPVPNRRLVRERAMQALYAYEIGHNVGGESIDFLAGRLVYPEFRNHSELLDFAQKLMLRVFNHVDECDTIIKSLAENWDFQRIAPIDKVLLRIGLTEMLFFPEIPTKASINEAIEIAKRYSTDKSGMFLNGVLDAALTKIKAEGRLNKTGRGLIEE